MEKAPRYSPKNFGVRPAHLIDQRRIPPQAVGQIFFNLARRPQPRAPLGGSVREAGEAAGGGIGEHREEGGVGKELQVGPRVFEVPSNVGARVGGNGNHGPRFRGRLRSPVPVGDNCS